MAYGYYDGVHRFISVFKLTIEFFRHNPVVISVNNVVVVEEIIYNNLTLKLHFLTRIFCKDSVKAQTINFSSRRNIHEIYAGPFFVVILC